MTENTTEENSNDNQNNVAFNMQKIYIKDVSFEAPAVPEAFAFEGGYKPNINLELNTNQRKLADDTFEVALNITVTAKADETVLFLCEVKQCGVFTIQNMEDDSERHTLGSFCPSILFPYARQTISNLILDGGFPQLLLAHINFDQLFFANEERRKNDDTEATAVESDSETPTNH